MTDNAIVHFDISGPEEDALRSFYGELLGWKVDPQGPGYALVHTPGGLRGSLIEAEAAQVTIGVGVRDLDKALGDAERWVEPWSCPRRTTLGSSKDRSETRGGNVLTLIQQSRSHESRPAASRRNSSRSTAASKGPAAAPSAVDAKSRARLRHTSPVRRR